MRSRYRIFMQFIGRIVLWGAGLISVSAVASELIYTPVNPTFGGNPLNGSYLLGKAQSQNDHGDDGLLSSSSNPLSRFEENLQRNILNQIARQIADEAFGEDNLGEGGTYNTDQFTIDIITTNPDVITIRIENKDTGETTEIEVPVFG